jgi:cytochrome oxidase Cu insertion factor (SCO1/SenC/PrrC family)
VLLLDEDRPPQLAGDLHEVYANFKLLTDPRAGLSTALAKTSGAGNAGTDGTIYLVDPLGNIMMFYPSGADPNHLKQDLKRLLTWSKLDEQ